MNRDLDRRLAALEEAAELAEGRLDPDVVDEARAVTAKAGARLGLGIEKTVVALAGPTGVGKSRLFNVLTGTELAAVSRRRPTTSVAQAATWGNGADALLDWLEIDTRHELEQRDLDGLVLIDLPDFDSVETSHRVEVDRVVALADLVVWTVEPQKYGDALLHEHYLRPLRSHAAAMALVLNQADLLSSADIAAWREDAKRLLVQDGLREVPLIVASALTGDGLADLRRLLAERVAARDAAVQRIAADVDQVAARLAGSCGEGRAAGVRREDRDRLVAALEGAAGAPSIVEAVAAAHRRRGALATGWPFVRWLGRLRPDPLRRLRLPQIPQDGGPTSVSPPTHVQRAQVATAARRLADGAATDLPFPWPTLVRASATGSEERIADRLDRAVANADLNMARPRWWTAAATVQRLLALVLVAGLLWLLGLAILGYLQVDDVIPLPEIRDVPLPTWFLTGGAAAGIVLAFLARFANGLSARRRARTAARSLRRQIEDAAEELVVAPVEEELNTYVRFCAAVEAAARGRRPGLFGARRPRGDLRPA